MSFWTLFAVCLLVLLVQAFVIQIAALSALQLSLRVRWEALVQLAALFWEASAGRALDLPPEAAGELEALRECLAAGPRWENAGDVVRLHELLTRCLRQPEFFGDARGAVPAGPDALRFAAVLALRVKNACAAYDEAVVLYEERRGVAWVAAVASLMGYEAVERLEKRIGPSESNVGSGRVSG
jgi:hypothetical protein